MATLRCGLKWMRIRYDSLRYIWAAGGRGIAFASGDARPIYALHFKEDKMKLA